MLLWQAAAESRDFRKARWTSTRLAHRDSRWLTEIARPVRGFNAALIECRYPQEPLPLLLTTSVHVQAAA